MNRSQINTRQTGLTLIELMVSLGLSLLLMVGVATVFEANRTTFNLQEGLSGVQENARIAMSKMEDDIRSAGYSGCGSQKNRFLNLLRQDSADLQFFWDFSKPVQGYEAGTDGLLSPSLPDSIMNKSSAKPSKYNDVLTVRFVEHSDARVVRHNYREFKQGGTDTGWMKLTGQKGLEKGDIVIAATCESAVIYQVTKITGQKIFFASNTTDKPGNIDSGNTTSGGDSANLADTELDYTGGEVGVLKTRTYYVREGASGEPALWRIDNGSAQEMVEGVESLQITYGVDRNQDRIVDAYYTAKQIEDNATGNLAWDRVTSVRINMVVRSRRDDLTGVNDKVAVELSDTDGSTNLVYFPDPADSGETDQRLRHVFTTTVALRNKAL